MYDNNCILCEESADRLYNGLCIDCLTWLYEHHTEEVHEWYISDTPDELYDLSLDGCREFCLEDDPYYFAEWVLEEHEDWIREVEDNIHDNYWKWLETLHNPV